MDTIWDRKTFDVGGLDCCCGDEQNEWPRRTDKNRTLKQHYYYHTLLILLFHSCVIKWLQ